MANTYLTRTPSSAGNQKIFTLSFWWKNNSQQNSDKCFFSSGLNSSNYFMIRTTGNEEIQILNIDNGSQAINYKPNRYYRDANAWYHIVIAIDTTQGSGDRIKWYTNGVRETSFSSSTEPSSNANVLYVNDTTAHAIGRKNVTSDKYMEGTLSHYHFIDGTQYAASDFGETDANGVWKIKTDVSVTYGTNGFFILKDGNSVTDQSGNSNNFTVAGGTLTNTEDSPSNVFATFNPLAGYYNGSTFSNGNNTVVTGTTQYSYDRATLGASSGKYYWEIQYAGRSGGSIPYSLIGISSTQPKNTTDFLGKYSYDWAYYVTSSSKIMNASTETSYGTSYGDNDIIGVAMDLDNYKLYFSKNGTWQNSGDPTSGSTGTGAISIVNPSTASYGIDTPLGAYFPAVSFYDGGVSGTYKANFGNGYFGTTALSSAGTNASGIGIFEYDVPTGFTALSTKGLNL